MVIQNMPWRQFGSALESFTAAAHQRKHLDLARELDVLLSLKAKGLSSTPDSEVNARITVITRQLNR